jgi:hypothetical protein
MSGANGTVAWDDFLTNTPRSRPTRKRKGFHGFHASADHLFQVIEKMVGATGIEPVTPPV